MRADAQGVARPVLHMSSLLLRYRRVLFATAKLELVKRYAGSVLGVVWIFLYPAVLLSIYLFLYLVIFRVRLPEYSEFTYVLYVLCGLVPYIGFLEAVTVGSLSIKQNIHLIQNVVLPIELVPVRVVIVSLATQSISLVILLVLLAIEGSLSLHLAWLPAVMLLQAIGLIGLVWIVAALAVPLPDLGYFLNLAVLFLMFVSPIAFKPEMMPEQMRFIVYLNPISYMIEMFRSSLLHGRVPDATTIAVYVTISLGVYWLGAVFFYKFKDHLADYA